MEETTDMYRTYLDAYVEAMGAGRFGTQLALAETTEVQRAAIAVAVYDAKRATGPATMIDVTRRVREMLKAPGAPVAPVAPPTPEG